MTTQKIAYGIGESVSLSSTSDSVVRQTVTSGALPSHRNGRDYLILHEDLVAWIKADCPRTKQEAAA